MEYTNLKGTGLKVSRFCLGTMTFGDQTAEPEARQIVDCALEQGVNFFDTADGYTGGLSEQILGRALEGRRENAVIATKVTNPTGPGVVRAGGASTSCRTSSAAYPRCGRTISTSTTSTARTPTRLPKRSLRR